ncbi:hypothetical protein D4764_01G0007710 [Takifugu flavidus]|uniref:Uncharacterized protein n=1 Tax=Takifugu flavidus TaxID=433684 RepID=A0A5C6PPZ7_9TELE|nr:hypothetical protein D4764_01G0007710 [Takifugu flavidus]
MSSSVFISAYLHLQVPQTQRTDLDAADASNTHNSHEQTFPPPMSPSVAVLLLLAGAVWSAEASSQFPLSF